MTIKLLFCGSKMKKAATWLWVAVAIVNLGVGAIITHTSAFMTKTYAVELGGARLPLVTERVLAVSSWPYGVTVLAILGAVFCAVTAVRKEVIAAVLVGVLLAEVVGLALTTWGLCLPLYIPLKVMTP